MYEMKIRVRYSEVDREGIARLHQILEYFQDCGTFQSEELGLGVEEDQKNHRAWYLIAWNVKIIRHPRMSEYIDVTTQAYKMRGFYGYRRYSIIDEQGNRSSRCFSVENAGEDLNLVSLFSLSDIFAGAGLSPVEIRLDISLA